VELAGRISGNGRQRFLILRDKLGTLAQARILSWVLFIDASDFSSLRLNDVFNKCHLLYAE